MRIYSSATEASDLRRAADRAEMVPAIVNYMAALEGAMVAGTDGRRHPGRADRVRRPQAELQQRLADTDVVPDVRLAVTTLLDDGQDLMDKVTANSIDLRDPVTTYAPLLLTAETAITGSVRVDDERPDPAPKRWPVPRRRRPRPDDRCSRCWSTAAANCPNPNCAPR